MSEQKKQKEEIKYKILPSNNKSKYRKPKRVPINYEQIDKWVFPEISREKIKGPFLEESSFATLFPKYREKYIRETFTFIQRALAETGIKAELDLLEGSLTVRTTKKTFDPYSIIKARDCIKLLARSVPYEVCLRMLNPEIYCDIIKIRSLVNNKEKFIKRRRRLIGPNGDTLKALEILTECYIMVQGSTVSVIGHFRKIKVIRRIIEDVMKNVHPVYFIKELMIKKELEKDEKLKGESWDRFLPGFKNIRENRKIKKKKRVKKIRKTFPDEQPKRKIDILMETGEYFLSEKEREKQKLEKIKIKQAKIKKLRDKQKMMKFEAPSMKEELKMIREKEQKKKVLKKKEENISDIVNKFKIDVKSDLV